MTTLKERIAEVLSELSDSELVELHNEYCYAVRYYDYIIEYMSSLDDMCYGMKATEIIEKFGNLDTSCEYYMVGIYDTTAFDCYDDAPTTYYDEIAEYCADNEDSLGNSDIEDAIDEYLEEKEAEEEEDEDTGDAWDNGGEDAYMEHYFEEKYGN